MNFFVVSAGKPGSSYIEKNFLDIIKTSEFALHKETSQKGTYFSIEKDDVLILKYNRKFVAYGIVLNQYINSSADFSHKVKVKEWIFHDDSDYSKGISRDGIQKATIGGGRYGTVKTVRPNFGIDKVGSINKTHPSYETIFSRYKEIKVSKDSDFFELHEEIFNHLLDKTDTDADFTFVIRESNNSSALENGYWFYGENTVAVSFWTGMDFKNQIPIISFLINPNEYCKLVISGNVRGELRNYLNEIGSSLLKEHSFERRKNQLVKEYSDLGLTDYIKSLDSFLKTDYNEINSLLDNFHKQFKKSSRGYVETRDNEVILFPKKQFNERLNNLFRYRQENSPELTLYSIGDERKADYLKSFHIRNFGLIKEQELEIGDSRWVFITGENGSGKTMLLRAIASVLGNRALTKRELKDDDFEAEANMGTFKRDVLFYRKNNENLKLKRDIIARGLAMYGPYRLEQASSLVNNETFRRALSKKGSFASLFEEGAKLLSIDKQFELWKNKSTRNERIINARMNFISALLPKIIPDLQAILYKEKNNGKYDFQYLINSEGTDELMQLKWDELSSGNRNILNLVTDIIIRLFHQQPRETDPSELRGIVIIDEIDLHLHPKAQKELISTLSETFPQLQFIVTTHSPIPLLGAPENSAIFVVKRDWERGVYAQRLKKLEKELQFLLPNTLLTSDIFDFDILEDVHDMNELILEDDYIEKEKNAQINERLKSFDKSIFPDNLFNS